MWPVPQSGKYRQKLLYLDVAPGAAFCFHSPLDMGNPVSHRLMMPRIASPSSQPVCF